jgi:restriction system protein
MAYTYWYEIEVHHDGLGKYRHIRGTDHHVVEQKARAQRLQWDEMWEKRQEAERRRSEVERERERRTEAKEDAAASRERSRADAAARKAAERQAVLDYKAERQAMAESQTQSAQAALDELAGVLAHTLTVDDTIQWEQLKDHRPFHELRTEWRPPSRPPEAAMPVEPGHLPPPAEPVVPPLPVKPEVSPLPKPPNRDDPRYKLEMGLLAKLIGPLRQAEINKVMARFDTDKAAWVAACEALRREQSIKLKLWQSELQRHAQAQSTARQDWQARVDRVAAENAAGRARWEEEAEFIRAGNARAVAAWQERMARYETDYPGHVAAWEARRAAHVARQAESNAAIEQKRADYLAREPGAVRDYCEMVLANSEYPAGFPQEFDLDYQADSRILVVEYALPAPDVVPTLKAVQYQASKDDFKESHITPKDRVERYDALLYQMALRTLHELFEADVADALDAVVFNGLVTSLNTAVGHEVTACVLSVQAGKTAFVAINLAQVDPKACFKSLKGVAAAQLSGLAPVAPILQIDKSDRRFVESYAVADGLAAGDNLATMHWEDFEHLIRELFEKEFSANGGEVRVTQASRDGGVDAVVFDPDPIRGGKIVIQAKRYANTVGVSAVRDLYGTMMNEGAMKGILVTTANYGPDAYEFSRGKPLTLLNGANLLHLLERHGHQARINLQEAKMNHASL